MTLLDGIVGALRPYEFRGKGRLFSRLIPKDGVRRVRVYGAWMELDVSDYIQRAIYMGCVGSYEVREVRRCLRPGGVMVDLGANVGYFTALAAHRVGRRGRVFAIEPSPYAFERLSRMVTESGLHAVTVGAFAVGEREGELPLYVPPDSKHNHSPTMVAADGWRATPVRVRTLDSCLAEWGVRTVDLVKMDVEGHEAKVLAGATAALAERRIRAILCEFNDFWLRESGSSPQVLWETLAAAGFVHAERPGFTPSFRPGCIETHLLVLGA